MGDILTVWFGLLSLFQRTLPFAAHPTCQPRASVFDNLVIVNSRLVHCTLKRRRVVELFWK